MSLSPTAQKLKRMLKLTTEKQTDRQSNKQTGQKQYDPGQSILEHKNYGTK